MKKTMTLSFFAIAFCIANLFSTAAKAQAVEEGNIIIDAYYGFPNLWSSLLKTAYAEATEEYKVKSMGPIGGRVEYLLSDKIGLGIDIHTANSSVEWTDNISSPTTYKVSYSRLRICPRINIHFSNNDKLDFYSAFGIGYRTSRFKFTSTPVDPDFENSTVDFNTIPVTWRAALGLRYFFTKNLGASLEMGLGGVLATAGISAKF